MTNFFDSPILITGIPRSGTSLIAGSIALCGAWKGSTVGANLDNPKGFFEHKGLRDVIDYNIFVRLGWDPVKKLPPVNYTVNNSNLKNIIWKILKNDGYKNNKPWLYKSPKASLIWRLYNDAFPRAKWIIVKRNEKSIINSLIKARSINFHSTDPVFWKSFIKEYNLRIEKLKETLTDYKEICSLEVINEDYSNFKKIINWLDLTFEKEKIEKFVIKNFYQID